MGFAPMGDEFQRITIEIRDVKDPTTDWQKFKEDLAKVLRAHQLRAEIKEIVNISPGKIQRAG